MRTYIRYQKKEKNKTTLSGYNFSLENIQQRGGTITWQDKRNIKDIYKKFGDIKLKSIPLISQLQLDIDQYILGYKTYSPLNYMNYQKEKAIKELNDYCGFEYYGAKHLKNIFTKF